MTSKCVLCVACVDCVCACSRAHVPEPVECKEPTVTQNGRVSLLSAQCSLFLPCHLLFSQLLLACKALNIRLLRRCLFMLGCDPNTLLEVTPHYKATPLIIAQAVKLPGHNMKGRAVFIDTLLKAKANPNAKDSNGAELRHFQVCFVFCL